MQAASPLHQYQDTLHKRGRFQQRMQDIYAEQLRLAAAKAAASKAPVNDFVKFNQWLGNPLDKADQPISEVLPWHVDVRDRIRKHKHTIINKFTGAAMTEIIPRIMLEMMLTDFDPARARLKQFAMITGVRMKLTQDEIEGRVLPMLERNHQDLVESYSKTEARIDLTNGRYIQGYPTMNVDAARGQDDLNFVFIDEAAFFQQTDQEKVYNVFSRYDLKTQPWIVWNSTPNGMTGNFWKIWSESLEGKNDYHRIELNYKLGLGSLLSQEEVDEARANSPRMFRQEYNCEFVAPEGAVMPDIHRSADVKEIPL